MSETTYGERPTIEDNADPLAEFKQRGVPEDVSRQPPPTTKADPPAETAQAEVKTTTRATSTRRSPKKKAAVPVKEEEPVELVRINFLLPKTVHRQFRQHCFDAETTITAELRQYITSKFGGKTKPGTKPRKKRG